MLEESGRRTPSVPDLVLNILNRLLHFLASLKIFLCFNLEKLRLLKYFLDPRFDVGLFRDFGKFSLLLSEIGDDELELHKSTAFREAKQYFRA